MAKFSVIKEGPRQFTVAEWEETLQQTALLVTRYGEVYLPLFERAEKELASAKQREEMLSRVRRIAAQSH